MSGTKKIVYDNIIFNLQKLGGISTYWFELSKRLCVDEEVNPYFLTAPNNNILAKGLNFADVEKVHSEVSWPKLLGRFINPSLNEINHPFIFHSSYNRITTNRNAKNVTTVHDLIHHKYYSGLRQWLHNWQKGNALLNSSRIITVSENTKRDLLRYFPHLKPDFVKVVYNGVSNDFYELPQDYMYDFPDSLLKETYLLCFSSSENYKNFKFTIELASRLPDFKLYIVGPPPNKIETAVLDKLVPRRWTVFSSITNKKLNELYNHAFALIYPSSYEGFGIPLLEAMRAACPFIALNSSSIPEVAGNAGVLVDELVLWEFQKAIDLIHSQRQEIVNRGKLQCSHFSWDKCYEETKLVYEEIL